MDQPKDNDASGAVASAEMLSSAQWWCDGWRRSSRERYLNDLPRAKPYNRSLKADVRRILGRPARLDTSKYQQQPRSPSPQ